jgi:hypothetical protein
MVVRCTCHRVDLIKCLPWHAAWPLGRNRNKHRSLLEAALRTNAKAVSLGAAPGGAEKEGNLALMGSLKQWCTSGRETNGEFRCLVTAGVSTGIKNRLSFNARANPALNLAPFGRWTLRDKAAQRRLALR